jgi:flagellar hook-associated protein FlgK
MVSHIEQLLGQLEPKFLTKVQEYLEYLLLLQRNKPKRTASKSVVIEKTDALTTLRQFRGDAPFPHITVSKSDIYEQ